MNAKCDRCGTDFDHGGSADQTSGPVWCPRCDFLMALSQDDHFEAQPSPGKPSAVHRFLTFPFGRLFRHPLVVLAAMAVGVWFGILFPWSAAVVAPFGQIYISLLEIAVFPILIAGIVTGIGSFLAPRAAGIQVAKLLAIFSLLLFLTGLIPLTAGLLGQPGSDLSSEAQATLGKLLSQSDRDTFAGSAPGSGDPHLTAFFRSMIPGDVFQFLFRGRILHILVFSLVLGLAVGRLSKSQGHLILALAEAFFQAFFKIYDWMLNLLPLGLFALMAGQIGQTWTGLFKPMGTFLVAAWGSCLVLMVVSVLTIRLLLGVTIKQIIKAFEECLVVAFGTRSSLAALPALLKGLDHLEVDREVCKWAAPLGVSMFNFGMVIVFALTAVFVAQLYEAPLGPLELILAVALSAVAAISGGGFGPRGLASLALAGIVLDPLSLPSGAGLAILAGITPMIEPIAALANVQAIAAAIAWGARGTGHLGEMDEDAGQPPEKTEPS